MKAVTFTVLFFVSPLFLQAQAWQSNMEIAIREASIQNKNILLFFSVADACDTCRRLETNIFQSSEFLTYAKENLVLVKLDFKDTQNSADKSKQLLIVEKYNKDGFFPLVVLVNESGRTIGKTSLYDGQSPSNYVAEIKVLDK